MTMRPWPTFRRNIVAILRGLRPEESEAVVGALIEAGLEAIEIPLNSPDPCASIERSAKLAPDGVLIGAGTVLTPAQVVDVHNAGGRLLVSPNVEPEVLDAAGERGFVTMPGVMTPTEALLALRHNASALKFFPASVIGASGIKAVRAILPPDTVVGAVGGVDETSFADYRAAGIRAFGMGSSLYAPGMGAAEVAERARVTVDAYDKAFADG